MYLIYINKIRWEKELEHKKDELKERQEANCTVFMCVCVCLNSNSLDNENMSLKIVNIMIDY